MKSIHIKSLFLGIAALLISKASHAENDHQFEVGPEFSYHSLNEKINGVDVNKLKGPMIGVQGVWNFHMGRNFLSVNPRYAASKQKYKNRYYGSQSSGHNSLFEVRGLFGRDFDLMLDAVISPYIGLGYRLFRNQAGKSFGNSLSWGHLSGTNYLYAPIGFDAKFKLQDMWSLTFNAELDILLNSSVRATRFGTKTETHTSRGLGFRTSLGLGIDFASLTLEGKPYLRYWSVDASGHKCGFCGRHSQPKHSSTELGFGVSVKF
jgi:hypothetical protein